MVTNGSVTGLVERLEADGYVELVTPDDDRRVTLAKLTDDGTALFTRMAAAHEGWLQDMFADVDSTAISSLWSDIGAVKASVGNYVSGQPLD
ncbi:hypothetical protein D9M72_575820 [compost metagenome]